MPDLAGLLVERVDEARMRVAERVDRDAGGEIEIALAIGRDQPNAFAPLEGEVDARIGRQQMRGHGTAHSWCVGSRSRVDSDELRAK